MTERDIACFVFGMMAGSFVILVLSLVLALAA